MVRRKYLLCAACVLLVGLLSGCGVSLFRSAEELYAQPRLPEQYKALSSTIQTVASAIDGEQIAPLSGSSTAAIQLVDLDGDGVEEAAAAFFRANSAEDPQPLKIFLFRSSGAAYEVAWVLQGEGNNVNSVAYEDLNGDGSKEVVVSWQLTSRANLLSVYALRGKDAEELVHTTYNESYALADLDGDGVRELMIVQRDDTGEDHSRVNWYLCQNGTLLLAATTNLSDSVVDVTAVRAGLLSDKTPALYVTSECEGGRVTDILVWQADAGLVNVTLNPDSRISNDTLRSLTDVNVMDIDGDGVLEVPVSETLPPVSPDSTAVYWLTHWRQFDRSGRPASVCVTYHATSDGWYLIVPSSWDGHIAVEQDNSKSFRGERAVVFYHQERSGRMTRFMTVYRLTGDNRLSWATNGERQLLRATTSTAYAVELFPGSWDCGLNVDQIRERFKFITTEWAST